MDLDRPPQQSRVLALDIGSKRIGLALWEPLSQLARPLTVRKRKTLKEDLVFFEHVVREQAVEALVVGLPISLGGNVTESTKTALFWIEQLKQRFHPLPVYSFDESLSTKEAIALMKDRSRKKKAQAKDKVAAALILEGFMREISTRLYPS